MFSGKPKSALLVVLPLLLVALLISRDVHAFAKEDIEKLKAEKNCPGCDLRNADLSGMNLSGANLEGANMLGAKLDGANLSDAFLGDASLQGASIKGTNFNHAGLDEATWVDGRTCGQGSDGVCK